MNGNKAKKMVLAIELDHAELTVRLLEIGVKLHRPKGQSGADAMQSVRDMVKAGKAPGYIVQDFDDMATAAIAYIRDQINSAQSVN